jgi:hypothetical protein
MTGQTGGSLRTASRTRGAFSAGRAGAIRTATLAGGALAFVGLCCLSPVAHAGPPAQVSAMSAVGVLLALLTLLSLAGWYRAHRRLAQCRAAQQHSREAEMRACAARGSDAAQAFERERARLVGEMHAFAAGPLAALAALVGSLDAPCAPAREQARLRHVQSAAGTCAHVLDALLATLSHLPPPVVLDEDTFDLRALIEGVAALLEPAAAQKGVRLDVHIDATLAEQVVADRARLGQVVYGLASRAVAAAGRGTVTVLAHAEVLNAGSQRIFISVSHARARWQARDAHAGADARRASGPTMREPGPLDDAAFALYRRLADLMQGEFAVGHEGDDRPYATFSAAFPIGHARVSREPGSAGDDRHACDDRNDAPDAPDAYDRRYLDALSEEGIDLPAFLGRWRASMQDDLAQLRRLRGHGDADAVRALLHRLSGAVGLVGAHGLTEALRQASAAADAPETPLLDTFAERIELLIARHDAQPDAQLDAQHGAGNVRPG